MGNTTAKHQSSTSRPKKNVHWKSAEPASAPGKPLLVHSDESDPDVVTLKWERPRTDGGSTLFGYHVEHRRTGSPQWVRSTPTLILYPEVVLSGLEPGWRYQFRVAAENAVGVSEYSELSEPLTVTLHRNAASAPQFQHELPDTTVIENEKVEFHVSLTGAPTPQISWFKDGFEVFSSRRTKIQNDPNSSTLIIHQTALTDEGEIKCTATNRIGHVATKAMLRIEAPPKIRLPRQYEDGLLIEADEVVRLKVGLAGRPSPLVVWSHNGEEIVDGVFYELTTTDKNSTLKIANSKRSDRGEYHLRAVNQLGVDSVSFLVTVTDRPSKPGKVSVTMSIGKSVTLSWSEPIDDGGCKIGNYVVEYFRLGWNVWLKAVTTRQLTATLSDLIEGSEYKFRVKAESPYGMSDPSDESDVMFVPDPKRGLTKPESPPKNNDATTKLKKSKPESKPIDRSGFDENPKTSTATKKADLDPPKQPNVRVPSPKLFDSDIIAREMSYGTSSGIQQKQGKLKRDLNVDDEQILRDMLYDRSEQTYNPRSKPTTTLNQVRPAPILKTRTGYNKNLEDQIQSHRIDIEKLNEQKKETLTAHRRTTDEVHTSNEFMLVLYEKDGKGESAGDSLDPEFDSILPPQLSLSTPELGVEGPVAPVLRRCVSSTELLYEKAMQRFYKAVEFEETENIRRSASVEPRHVPHELPISRRKLGSFGEADALERRNSLRSKPVADTTKSTKSEATKPQDIIKPISSQIDEDTISISEDRDLKREIMDAHRKLSVRNDNLTPTSSMEFDEDYTESTASSGSMTSMDSMEQFKNVIRSISKDKPDEIDTFNPMMSSRTVSSSIVRTINDGAIDSVKMKATPLSTDDHPSQEARFEKLLQQSLESTDPEELLSEEELEERQPSPRRNVIEIKRSPSHDARALSPYRLPEPNQSTIALTRPFALPDPDFVPKPILKRPSIEETPNKKEKSKSKPKKVEKQEKPEKPEKSEKKGGILQMFKKNTSNEEKKSEALAEKGSSLTDVAATKMSASALAKKKSMERRQSSLEENKVAIDHYSDIVSAVAAHRTPKVPIYLSVDDLKKVAEKEAAEKKRLTTQSSVTSNVSSTSNASADLPRQVSRSPVPPISKPKESDNRSIFAIKLSKDPKKMAEPVVVKPPIDFSRSVSIEDEPQSTSKRSSVASVTPKTTKEASKSPTRGRSTATESTKKRTPSATRSRSSSTVRKVSATRDSSTSRPTSTTGDPPAATRQRNPLKTRSASKTRSQSQSKSPSSRNRKLHVARIGINDKGSSADSPEPRSQTPEQLLDEAEKTVKSTMAYAMDISMLIVACWVYMFKDARLVVPILVLLVYRQVSSALKDKIPNWMKRKRSNEEANEE